MHKKYFSQFHGYCLFIFALLLLLPSCRENSSLMELEKVTRKDTSGDEKITIVGKKIDRMNLEEAINAHKYYRSTGNKHLLIKSIERIITLSSDYKIISPYLIELGNLKFEFGNFGESKILFSKYAEFYPGEIYSQYARYMEIKSSQLTESDPHRDPSKTEKTIELSKRFLEDFSNKNKYFKKVLSILDDSRYKLLEGEINRAEFYLNKHLYTGSKGSLKSANNRLIYLKEEIVKYLIQEKKKLKKVMEEIKENLSIEKIKEIIKKIKAILFNHDSTYENIRKNKKHKKNIKDRF